MATSFYFRIPLEVSLPNVPSNIFISPLESTATSLSNDTNSQPSTKNNKIPSTATSIPTTVMDLPIHDTFLSRLPLLRSLALANSFLHQPYPVSEIPSSNSSLLSSSIHPTSSSSSSSSLKTNRILTQQIISRSYIELALSLPNNPTFETQLIQQLQLIQKLIDGHSVNTVLYPIYMKWSQELGAHLHRSTVKTTSTTYNGSSNGTNNKNTGLNNGRRTVGGSGRAAVQGVRRAQGSSSSSTFSSSSTGSVSFVISPMSSIAQLRKQGIDMELRSSLIELIQAYLPPSFVSPSDANPMSSSSSASVSSTGIRTEDFESIYSKLIDFVTSHGHSSNRDTDETKVSLTAVRTFADAIPSLNTLLRSYTVYDIYRTSLLSLLTTKRQSSTPSPAFLNVPLTEAFVSILLLCLGTSQQHMWIILQTLLYMITAPNRIESSVKERITVVNAIDQWKTKIIHFLTVKRQYLEKQQTLYEQSLITPTDNLSSNSSRSLGLLSAGNTGGLDDSSLSSSLLPPTSRQASKAAEKLLRTKRGPLPLSLRVKAEAAAAGNINNANSGGGRVGTLQHTSTAQQPPGTEEDSITNGSSSTNTTSVTVPQTRTNGTVSNSSSSSSANVSTAPSGTKTAMFGHSKASTNSNNNNSSGTKTALNTQGTTTSPRLNAIISSLSTDNAAGIPSIDGSLSTTALSSNPMASRSSQTLLNKLAQKQLPHDILALQKVLSDNQQNVLPPSAEGSTEDDSQYALSVALEETIEGEDTVGNNETHGVPSRNEGKVTDHILLAKLNLEKLNETENEDTELRTAYENCEIARQQLRQAINELLGPSWLIPVTKPPHGSSSTNENRTETGGSSPLITDPKTAPVPPNSSAYTWYSKAQNDGNRNERWQRICSNALNEVWTVGQNTYGECGTGDTQHHRRPVRVESLQRKGVISIAAGNEHTVVVTALGEALAVGYNDSGQCGCPSVVPPNNSTDPTTISTVQLAARLPHFSHVQCSITTTAANDRSITDEENSNRSSFLSSMSRTVPLTSVHTFNGCEHTFLLSENGQYCFGQGYNLRYQLGLGHQLSQSSPTLVRVSSTDDTINAPNGSSSLSSSTTIVTPTGSIPRSLKPVPISVVKIACSYYHSLFVTNNGAVYGCGRNDAGQLSRSFLGDAKEPVLLVPLHDPAYRKAINLYGGRKDLHPLGDDFTQDEMDRKVKQHNRVSFISATSNNSRDLTASVPLVDRISYSTNTVTNNRNNLSSSPSHTNGPSTLLALNTFTAANAAADVLPFTVQEALALRIVAGHGTSFRSGTSIHSPSSTTSPYHTYSGTSSTANISNGTMDHEESGFSDDDEGYQPPTNRTTQRAAKQDKDSLSDTLDQDTLLPPDDGCWVKSISAGQYHSILVLSDGRVYAAGRNDWGQTALGTSACTRIFTRIINGVLDPSVAQWKSARKQLIEEHYQQYKQLPYAPLTNNTVSKTDVPLLPTPTVPLPIVQVACGYYHTLLLSSDGRVIAFGRNDSGMCGIGLTNTDHNNTTNTLEPKIFQPRFVWIKDSLPVVAPVTINENVTAAAENENRSLAAAENLDDRLQKKLDSILGESGKDTDSSNHPPQQFLNHNNNNNKNGQESTPTSPQLTPARSILKSSLSLNSSVSPSRSQGNNFIIPNLLPPLAKRVKLIAAGCYHSFATVGKGSFQKLYGWGRNHLGQLGVGDTAEHTIPTEIHIPGVGLPPCVGNRPMKDNDPQNMYPEFIDNYVSGYEKHTVMNVTSIAAGFYHTVFLVSPVPNIPPTEENEGMSTLASGKETVPLSTGILKKNDGKEKSSKFSTGNVLPTSSTFSLQNLIFPYTLISSLLGQSKPLERDDRLLHQQIQDQFTELVPSVLPLPPAMEAYRSTLQHRCDNWDQAIVYGEPSNPSVNSIAQQSPYSTAKNSPLRNSVASSSLESTPNNGPRTGSFANKSLEASPSAIILSVDTGSKPIKREGTEARTTKTVLPLSFRSVIQEWQRSPLEMDRTKTETGNSSNTVVGGNLNDNASVKISELSTTCASVYSSLLLLHQVYRNRNEMEKIQSAVHASVNETVSLLHQSFVSLNTDVKKNPSSVMDVSVFPEFRAIQNYFTLVSIPSSGTPESVWNTTIASILHSLTESLVYLLRTGHGHELAPAISLIRIQLGSSIIPAVTSGAENMPVTKLLSSLSLRAWSTLNLPYNEDAVGYLGAFDDGLWDDGFLGSSSATESIGDSSKDTSTVPPLLLSEPTDAARLILATCLIIANAAFSVQNSLVIRTTAQKGLIRLLDLLVTCPPEISSLLENTVQFLTVTPTTKIDNLPVTVPIGVSDYTFAQTLCTVLSSPRFIPALDFHVTSLYGNDMVSVALAAWKLSTLLPSSLSSFSDFSKVLDQAVPHYFLYILRHIAAHGFSSTKVLETPFHADHWGGEDIFESSTETRTGDPPVNEEENTSTHGKGKEPQLRNLLSDAAVSWRHSCYRAKDESVGTLGIVFLRILPELYQELQTWYQTIVNDDNGALSVRSSSVSTIPRILYSTLPILTAFLFLGVPYPQYCYTLLPSLQRVYTILAECLALYETKVSLPPLGTATKENDTLQWLRTNLQTWGRCIALYTETLLQGHLLAPLPIENKEDILRTVIVGSTALHDNENIRTKITDESSSSLAAQSTGKESLSTNPNWNNSTFTEDFLPSSFAATPRNNYNYTNLPNNDNLDHPSSSLSASLSSSSGAILTDEEEYDQEQRSMWTMTTPKLQALIGGFHSELFRFGLHKAALQRLVESLSLSPSISNETMAPLVLSSASEPSSSVSLLTPVWLTTLTDTLHAKAHTLKFFESIQHQISNIVPGYRGALLQGKGPLRASRSLVWRSAFWFSDKLVIVISSDADAITVIERTLFIATVWRKGCIGFLPSFINRSNLTATSVWPRWLMECAIEAGKFRTWCSSLRQAWSTACIAVGIEKEAENIAPFTSVCEHMWLRLISIFDYNYGNNTDGDRNGIIMVPKLNRKRTFRHYALSVQAAVRLRSLHRTWFISKSSETSSSFVSLTNVSVLQKYAEGAVPYVLRLVDITGTQWLYYTRKHYQGTTKKVGTKVTTSTNIDAIIANLPDIPKTCKPSPHPDALRGMYLVLVHIAQLRTRTITTVTSSCLPTVYDLSLSSSLSLANVNTVITDTLKIMAHSIDNGLRAYEYLLTINVSSRGTGVGGGGDGGKTVLPSSPRWYPSLCVVPCSDLQKEFYIRLCEYLNQLIKQCLNLLNITTIDLSMVSLSLGILRLLAACLPTLLSYPLYVNHRTSKVAIVSKELSVNITALLEKLFTLSLQDPLLSSANGMAYMFFIQNIVSQCLFLSGADDANYGSSTLAKTLLVPIYRLIFRQMETLTTVPNISIFSKLSVSLSSLRTASRMANDTNAFQCIPISSVSPPLSLLPIIYTVPGPVFNFVHRTNESESVVPSFGIMLSTWMYTNQESTGKRRSILLCRLVSAENPKQTSTVISVSLSPRNRRLVVMIPLVTAVTSSSAENTDDLMKLSNTVLTLVSTVDVPLSSWMHIAVSIQSRTLVPNEYSLHLYLDGKVMVERSIPVAQLPYLRSYSTVEVFCGLPDYYSVQNKQSESVASTVSSLESIFNYGFEGILKEITVVGRACTSEEIASEAAFSASASFEDTANLLLEAKDCYPEDILRTQLTLCTQIITSSSFSTTIFPSLVTVLRSSVTLLRKLYDKYTPGTCLCLHDPLLRPSNDLLNQTFTFLRTMFTLSSPTDLDQMVKESSCILYLWNYQLTSLVPGQLTIHYLLTVLAQQLDDGYVLRNLYARKVSSSTPSEGCPPSLLCLHLFDNDQANDILQTCLQYSPYRTKWQTALIKEIQTITSRLHLYVRYINQCSYDFYQQALPSSLEDIANVQLPLRRVTGERMLSCNISKLATSIPESNTKTNILVPDEEALLSMIYLRSVLSVLGGQFETLRPTVTAWTTLARIGRHTPFMFRKGTSSLHKSNRSSAYTSAETQPNEQFSSRSTFRNEQELLDNDSGIPRSMEYVSLEYGWTSDYHPGWQFPASRLQMSWAEAQHCPVKVHILSLHSSFTNRSSDTRNEESKHDITLPDIPNANVYERALIALAPLHTSNPSDSIDKELSSIQIAGVRQLATSQRYSRTKLQEFLSRSGIVTRWNSSVRDHNETKEERGTKNELYTSLTEAWDGSPCTASIAAGSKDTAGINWLGPWLMDVPLSCLLPVRRSLIIPPDSPEFVRILADFVKLLSVLTSYNGNATERPKESLSSSIPVTSFVNSRSRLMSSLTLFMESVPTSTLAYTYAIEPTIIPLMLSFSASTVLPPALISLPDAVITNELFRHRLAYVQQLQRNHLWSNLSKREEIMWLSLQSMDKQNSEKLITALSNIIRQQMDQRSNNVSQRSIDLSGNQDNNDDDDHETSSSASSDDLSLGEPDDKESPLLRLDDRTFTGASGVSHNETDDDEWWNEFRARHREQQNPRTINPGNQNDAVAPTNARALSDNGIVSSSSSSSSTVLRSVTRSSPSSSTTVLPGIYNNNNQQEDEINNQEPQVQHQIIDPIPWETGSRQTNISYHVGPVSGSNHDGNDRPEPSSTEPLINAAVSSLSSSPIIIPSVESVPNEIATVINVSEDAVMRLMSMGFDRSWCIAALQLNHNDESLAASWVVDHLDILHNLSDNGVNLTTILEALAQRGLFALTNASTHENSLLHDPDNENDEQNNADEMDHAIVEGLLHSTNNLRMNRSTDNTHTNISSGIVGPISLPPNHRISLPVPSIRVDLSLLRPLSSRVRLRRQELINFWIDTKEALSQDLKIYGLAKVDPTDLNSLPKRILVNYFQGRLIAVHTERTSRYSVSPSVSTLTKDNPSFTSPLLPSLTDIASPFTVIPGNYLTGLHTCDEDHFPTDAYLISFHECGVPWRTIGTTIKTPNHSFAVHEQQRLSMNKQSDGGSSEEEDNLHELLDASLQNLRVSSLGDVLVHTEDTEETEYGCTYDGILQPGRSLLHVRQTDTDTSVVKETVADRGRTTPRLITTDNSTTNRRSARSTSTSAGRFRTTDRNNSSTSGSAHDTVTNSNVASSLSTNPLNSNGRLTAPRSATIVRGISATSGRSTTLSRNNSFVFTSGSSTLNQLLVEDSTHPPSIVSPQVEFLDHYIHPSSSSSAVSVNTTVPNSIPIEPSGLRMLFPASSNIYDVLQAPIVELSRILHKDLYLMNSNGAESLSNNLTDGSIISQSMAIHSYASYIQSEVANHAERIASTIGGNSLSTITLCEAGPGPVLSPTQGNNYSKYYSSTTNEHNILNEDHHLSSRVLKRLYKESRKISKTTDESVLGTWFDQFKNVSANVLNTFSQELVSKTVFIGLGIEHSNEHDNNSSPFVIRLKQLLERAIITRLLLTNPIFMHPVDLLAVNVAMSNILFVLSSRVIASRLLRIVQVSLSTVPIVPLPLKDSFVTIPTDIALDYFRKTNFRRNMEQPALSSLLLNAVMSVAHPSSVIPLSNTNSDSFAHPPSSTVTNELMTFFQRYFQFLHSHGDLGTNLGEMYEKFSSSSSVNYPEREPVTTTILHLIRSKQLSIAVLFNMSFSHFLSVVEQPFSSKHTNYDHLLYISESVWGRRGTWDSDITPSLSGYVNRIGKLSSFISSPSVEFAQWLMNIVRYTVTNEEEPFVLWTEVRELIPDILIILYRLMSSSSNISLRSFFASFLSWLCKLLSQRQYDLAKSTVSKPFFRNSVAITLGALDTHLSECSTLLMETEPYFGRMYSSIPATAMVDCTVRVRELRRCLAHLLFTVSEVLPSVNACTIISRSDDIIQILYLTPNSARLRLRLPVVPPSSVPFRYYVQMRVGTSEQHQQVWNSHYNGVNGMLGKDPQAFVTTPLPDVDENLSSSASALRYVSNQIAPDQSSIPCMNIPYLDEWQTVWTSSIVGESKVSNRLLYGEASMLYPSPSIKNRIEIVLSDTATVCGEITLQQLLSSTTYLVRILALPVTASVPPVTLPFESPLVSIVGLRTPKSVPFGWDPKSTGPGVLVQTDGKHHQRRKRGSSALPPTKSIRKTTAPTATTGTNPDHQVSTTTTTGTEANDTLSPDYYDDDYEPYNRTDPLSTHFPDENNDESLNDISSSSIVRHQPTYLLGKIETSQILTTATYTGTDAWSIVLGTCGYSSGKNRWAIRINRSSTSYIFIGVASSSVNLSQFLGSDEHGWGYLGDRALYHRHAKTATYGHRFQAGDVIGVELDSDAGTLSFSFNGIDQGIAFRHLTGKLYPAVAFYSHGQSISLLPQFTDCRGAGIAVPGAPAHVTIDDMCSCVRISDALLRVPYTLPPPTYVQEAYNSFLLWRNGYARRAITKNGYELTFDTSPEAFALYGGELGAGDRILCAKGEGEVIGILANRLWLRIEEDGAGAWYLDPIVPNSSSMVDQTLGKSVPNELSDLSSPTFARTRAIGRVNSALRRRNLLQQQHIGNANVNSSSSGGESVLRTETDNNTNTSVNGTTTADNNGEIGHNTAVAESISEAVAEIVAAAALRDETSLYMQRNTQSTQEDDEDDEEYPDPYATTNGANQNSDHTNTDGSTVGGNGPRVNSNLAMDRLGPETLHDLTSAMLTPIADLSLNYYHGYMINDNNNDALSPSTVPKGVSIYPHNQGRYICEVGNTRMGILVVLNRRNSSSSAGSTETIVGWENDGERLIKGTRSRTDSVQLSSDSKVPEDDTVSGESGQLMNITTVNRSQTLQKRINQILSSINGTDLYQYFLFDANIHAIGHYTVPTDDALLIQLLNEEADRTGKNPWNIMPSTIISRLPHMDALENTISQVSSENKYFIQFCERIRELTQEPLTIFTVYVAVSGCRLALLRSWNDKLRATMPFLDFSPLLRDYAISEPFIPAVSLKQEDTKSSVKSLMMLERHYQLASLPISIIRLRSLIFSQTKRSVLGSVLERTATQARRPDDEYEYPEDVPLISVNRARAITNAIPSNDPWYRLTHSVFGQTYEVLHPASGPQLRLGFSHPMDDGQIRTFRVRFEGEASDDYSGLYRELFAHIVNEVTATAVLTKSGAYVTIPSNETNGGSSDGRYQCILPLLYPIAPSGNGSEKLFILNPINFVGDDGKNYTVSPTNHTILPNDIQLHPVLESMFTFFGQFIGMALRSRIPLPIPMASLFWKQLVGEECTETDVRILDPDYYQSIDSAEQAAKLAYERNECTLEDSVPGYEDLSWIIQRSDGTDMVLIPPSLEKPNSTGTYGNNASIVTCQHLVSGIYRRAIVEARLHESNAAMVAVRRGFLSIIPAAPLPLFTGKQLELLVCGSNEVDIELLRANTEYDEGVSPSDPHVQALWTVLHSFTTAERQAFLRFVWARSRLPSSAAEFTQKFRIQTATSPDTNDNPGTSGGNGGGERTVTNDQNDGNYSESNSTTYSHIVRNHTNRPPLRPVSRNTETNGNIHEESRLTIDTNVSGGRISPAVSSSLPSPSIYHNSSTLAHMPNSMRMNLLVNTGNNGTVNPTLVRPVSAMPLNNNVNSNGTIPSGSNISRPPSGRFGLVTTEGSSGVGIGLPGPSRPGTVNGHRTTGTNIANRLPPRIAPSITMASSSSNGGRTSNNSANSSANPIDARLPTSHTCFFSLHLPRYSNAAVLRERLLYAIQHCIALDADYRFPSSTNGPEGGGVGNTPTTTRMG